MNYSPASLSALLAISTILSPLATPVQAQYDNSVRGVAEREIARRQEGIQVAMQYMQDGDKLMDADKYDEAVDKYQAAVDLLAGGSVTLKLREDAMEKFCEASVKLAELRISQGRYAEAETIVKTVLEDRYNPKYKRAVVLMA